MGRREGASGRGANVDRHTKWQGSRRSHWRRSAGATDPVIESLMKAATEVGNSEARRLLLSIVMPCLNEAETLARCIGEAAEVIQRHSIRAEIVIADNGSQDGSQAIARLLGARLVDVSQRGYGRALSAGIAASEGRYVVTVDSDASYHFADIPALLYQLQNGYDLVLGNRFLGVIEPGAMPWSHRYIGNPLLSGIGRLLFGSPVGDFHCGLRGFSRDAFDRMQLRSGGMEFASEMVVKATLLGMKITEIPTTLRPAGRSRPPHLRSFHDGWRHLRLMLGYAWAARNSRQSSCSGPEGRWPPQVA